jgi:hypothetical protein
MNLSQNVTEDLLHDRRLSRDSHELYVLCSSVHVFEQNPVLKEWEPIHFYLIRQRFGASKTHVLNVLD